MGPGLASPRPRVAGSRQAGQPAAMMKLVTTFAGLELLGPAFTWSTPVWLQGPVENGVLQGNVVIKGTGDPKLVLERMWLLMRRIQQLGVREIRGDIVMDRSAFAATEANPADFDGEPLRPLQLSSDDRLLTTARADHDHARPARGLASSRRPDACRPRCPRRLSVPLAQRPCEDWRAALKSASDPAAPEHGGAFACRRREGLAIAYYDPRAQGARAGGRWHELGGRLGGVVAREPHCHAAELRMRSPPLRSVRYINKPNTGRAALFLRWPHARGDGGRPGPRELLHGGCAEVGGAPSPTRVTSTARPSRESRLPRRPDRLLHGAWASPSCGADDSLP